MRASRLLALLMLLQERGRLSARVLAEKTAVSVRTIYRDVDHLSAAGVPVWAETGRNGGVCLQPGWRTQLNGLTTAEARALLLAGLPGPAADLGLGAAAVAAQPKLLAALPAAAQDEARRVGQRFHLDPVDWFRDASPPACLPDVAAAVWQGRRIAMRYESWKRVSDQVVEPLGLVLKAGTWYMAARRPDRGDPRPYRLAAVLSMRVLDEHFVVPPFELAAWWRDCTARFESGLYTDTARLQVTEDGYHRLCRFSPTVAAAAERSVAPCAAEGWVEVQVPIESVRHAARQMLELGDQAVVLAPPALRAALREATRAMAAAYADPA